MMMPYFLLAFTCWYQMILCCIFDWMNWSYCIGTSVVRVFSFTFLSLHQPSSSKFEVLLINFFHPLGIYAKCLFLVDISGAKAVEILEAYEGTLEDDYPPDNERCEHGEMLLYKVLLIHLFYFFACTCKWLPHMSSLQAFQILEFLLVYNGSDWVGVTS